MELDEIKNRIAAGDIRLSDGLARALPKFRGLVSDDILVWCSNELQGYTNALEYYQRVTPELPEYRVVTGDLKVVHSDGTFHEIHHPLAKRTEYFLSAPVGWIEDFLGVPGDMTIVDLPELTNYIGKQIGGTVVCQCHRTQLERILISFMDRFHSVIDSVIMAKQAKLSASKPQEPQWGNFGMEETQTYAQGPAWAPSFDGSADSPQAIGYEQTGNTVDVTGHAPPPPVPESINKFIGGGRKAEAGHAPAANLRSMLSQELPAEPVKKKSLIPFFGGKDKNKDQNEPTKPTTEEHSLKSTHDPAAFAAQHTTPNAPSQANAGAPAAPSGWGNPLAPAGFEAPAGFKVPPNAAGFGAPSAAARAATPDGANAEPEMSMDEKVARSSNTFWNLPSTPDDPAGQNLGAPSLSSLLDAASAPLSASPTQPPAELPIENPYLSPDRLPEAPSPWRNPVPQTQSAAPWLKQVASSTESTPDSKPPWLNKAVAPAESPSESKPPWISQPTAQTEAAPESKPPWFKPALPQTDSVPDSKPPWLSQLDQVDSTAADSDEQPTASPDMVPAASAPGQLQQTPGGGLLADMLRAPSAFQSPVNVEPQTEPQPFTQSPAAQMSTGPLPPAHLMGMSSFAEMPLEAASVVPSEPEPASAPNLVTANSWGNGDAPTAAKTDSQGFQEWAPPLANPAPAPSMAYQALPEGSVTMPDSNDPPDPTPARKRMPTIDWTMSDSPETVAEEPAVPELPAPPLPAEATPSVPMGTNPFAQVRGVAKPQADAAPATDSTSVQILPTISSVRSEPAAAAAAAAEPASTPAAAEATPKSDEVLVHDPHTSKSGVNWKAIPNPNQKLTQEPLNITPVVSNAVKARAMQLMTQAYGTRDLMVPTGDLISPDVTVREMVTSAVDYMMKMNWIRATTENTYALTKDGVSEVEHSLAF